MIWLQISWKLKTPSNFNLHIVWKFGWIPLGFYAVLTLFPRILFLHGTRLEKPVLKCHSISDVISVLLPLGDRRPARTPIKNIRTFIPFVYSKQLWNLKMFFTKLFPNLIECKKFSFMNMVYTYLLIYRIVYWYILATKY